jgi:hypothetical protein
MKPEEIVEGNKIIAKFMETSYPNWASGHQPQYWSNNWGWLMNAIDKVETILKKEIIGSVNCSYGINLKAQWFVQFPSRNKVYGETKIEAHFKAVVEFATWYIKYRTHETV